jgi:hypothetical protein
MSWFTGSPPQPPNPIATGAAQTGTNIGTAIANANLNNTNQVTPQGSLTYDQTGTYNYTDPTTGQSYPIPRFTATQNLSPAQQNLSNLGVSAQTNLANLASNQSGLLTNLLGTPFNPSTGTAATPGTPGTPATQSPYFNAQAYLAAYPDVAQAAAASGSDPNTFALQHYQQFGQAEGRTAGFPMIPGTQATPGTPATGAAPNAGNADFNIGDPLSAYNPGGLQQTTFGDAGAITTDYGVGDAATQRDRVEQALYQRMDPQLQRDRANLDAQLADKGMMPGSPGYQAAMDQFGRQLTDTRLGITAQGGQEQKLQADMAAQRAGFQNAAQQQAFTEAQSRGQFANTAQQAQYTQNALGAQFYNSAQAQKLANQQAQFNAANQARQQYLSEAYTQRQEPINEITSLMSGSQVSKPSFVNTPTNQIPTTDIAGLINTNFNQNLQNYQQQSQNFNQIVGGVFGALGGYLRSDRRAKENIHRMGTVFAASTDDDPKKLPIYAYSYKDDPVSTRHIGPMAQDVEKIDPGAVATRKGVKYIDRSRVMGSILRA